MPKPGGIHRQTVHKAQVPDESEWQKFKPAKMGKHWTRVPNPIERKTPGRGYQCMIINDESCGHFIKKSAFLNHFRSIHGLNPEDTPIGRPRTSDKQRNVTEATKQKNRLSKGGQFPQRLWKMKKMKYLFLLRQTVRNQKGKPPGLKLQTWVLMKTKELFQNWRSSAKFSKMVLNLGRNISTFWREVQPGISEVELLKKAKMPRNANDYVSDGEMPALDLEKSNIKDLLFVLLPHEKDKGKTSSSKPNVDVAEDEDPWDESGDEAEEEPGNGAEEEPGSGADDERETNPPPPKKAKTRESKTKNIEVPREEGQKLIQKKRKGRSRATKVVAPDETEPSLQTYCYRTKKKKPAPSERKKAKRPEVEEEEEPTALPKPQLLSPASEKMAAFLKEQEGSGKLSSVDDFRAWCKHRQAVQDSGFDGSRTANQTTVPDSESEEEPSDHDPLTDADPRAEALPLPEEEPLSEEEPLPREEPVGEEEPHAEEEPVGEEEPHAEEEPATEEIDATEEEPHAEEEPATEEIDATEEEPHAEEEPATEEEHATEEEPHSEEEPAAEETYATEEEPELVLPRPPLKSATPGTFHSRHKQTSTRKLPKRKVARKTVLKATGGKHHTNAPLEQQPLPEPEDKDEAAEEEPSAQQHPRREEEPRQDATAGQPNNLGLPANGNSEVHGDAATGHAEGEPGVLRPAKEPTVHSGDGHGSPKTPCPENKVQQQQPQQKETPVTESAAKVLNAYSTLETPRPDLQLVLYERTPPPSRASPTPSHRSPSPKAPRMKTHQKGVKWGPEENAMSKEVWKWGKKRWEQEYADLPKLYLEHNMPVIHGPPICERTCNKLPIVPTYERQPFPPKEMVPPFDKQRLDMLGITTVYMWAYHCRKVWNPFGQIHPGIDWPLRFFSWVGPDGVALMKTHEKELVTLRKKCRRAQEAKSKGTKGKREIGPLQWLHVYPVLLPDPEPMEPPGALPNSEEGLGKKKSSGAIG